jgi:cytochrome o ubiquinol oxidase operon protein cyoD
MGASSHDAHGAHGHSHGAATAGHGTRKDYLIGFGLAAVLTAIPFWLVMTHAISGPQAVFAVMGLAAVQVVVHMVYFLHMNSRSEGGWTMLALLFTVLIVGIVLSGSVWVMHHLDTNMMPMSPLSARQMP